MTKALQLMLVVGAGLTLQSDDSMRAVIEQALDQPTKLTIESAPLPEAFQKIAENTGLSVAIGPDALSYLPYGEATRVNVRLEHIRLREGIQAICNQLGMTYEITGNGIEIVPTPALERVGRTASWEELGLLSGLLQTPWQNTQADLQQLRRVVQFEAMPGAPEENWDALAAQLQGGGSTADALSRACGAIGCTWYPSGDAVVVLPIQDQIYRQLQRPVSVRCGNRPLAEVLRKLSHEAGMPIKIDPAAAAQLPDKVKQSFSLLAEGVTVEEALDQIGIAAGLAYEVSPGGVLLHAPDAGQESRAMAASSDRSSGRTDRIIGSVEMVSPDGRYRYQWFIRESDLSEEENAVRQRLVQEAAEALTQQ